MIHVYMCVMFGLGGVYAAQVVSKARVRMYRQVVSLWLPHDPSSESVFSHSTKGVVFLVSS